MQKTFIHSNMMVVDTRTLRNLESDKEVTILQIENGVKDDIFLVEWAENKDLYPEDPENPVITEEN